MGELSGRAVVGFYWTLPVPRYGFMSLPKDVDEAARLSKTIRYQRELFRRYVKEEGGRLVREAVFLEIHPDRGDEAIRGELRKAAKICREENALLVLVDFRTVQGWRSHAPLTEWLRRDHVEHKLLPAEPLQGEWAFDPHEHFRQWRERDGRWRAEKGARVAEAGTRAVEVRREGLSFPKVAETLNAEGFVTATGKPWTGDNVRKLLR